MTVKPSAGMTTLVLYAEPLSLRQSQQWHRPLEKSQFVGYFGSEVEVYLDDWSARVGDFDVSAVAGS